MRRANGGIVMAAISLFAVAALAAAVLFEDDLTGGVPPDDPRGMAQWLVRHPSDWLTAARLTEMALESESPARLQVWKVLHAHSKRLAPHLPNADAAFVRAGLFHWYELTPSDRNEVIAAATPLMQSPGIFEQLYRPLWQLTRDMRMLRRISPPSLAATAMLKRLAVEEALFDDYRELREQERQRRLAFARELAAEGRAAELFGLLPSPLRSHDHEVVELALQSFSKHAGPVDELRVPLHLINYVLRHRPASAGALKRILADPFYPAPTRARLALALGEPGIATQIETAAADLNSPQWTDYYLERALVEARAGQAAAADTALDRAVRGGLTPAVLETAADAARLLGREAQERTYRAQFEELSTAQPRWKGTCGQNELCTDAATEVTGGGPAIIDLAVVQTDEVPPYVEVYIDDRLVHEAAVTDSSRVQVDLPQGDHVIDVHVVNPRTRSGLQRRLRIS